MKDYPIRIAKYNYHDTMKSETYISSVYSNQDLYSDIK